MKINKETSLEKLLENREAAAVLAEHQVPCMGCPMASIEMDQLTLGQVCETYGLDFEEIREDLEELE
jgi:hypothetical protein